MNNRDFEKILKQAMHQPPTINSREHLEYTCLLAEKEICQRHARERISFIRFLAAQIRFIGWKVWAVQGIFLLAVCTVLTSIYGNYFFERPHTMAKVLFCLSVIVCMTAIPFIYRSVRYQMQEIEAAAYFSSVKLLTAKLMVIGIGDIFILTGIFITTIIKTSLQAGSATLYLCLPFLIVSSICLFLLGHFTPKNFFAGSIGFCSFLIIVCAVLPTRFESLFQQSFSIGWMAVCTLLTAFCIQQFRYILYRSAYTEMQIA